MFNIFVRAIALIFSESKKNRPRIHNYTKLTRGEDYLFEPLDGGMKGYITAQRQGVRQGDYLILLEDNNSFRYIVEEIDYYANPSDMWIALLKKETIKEEK